MIAQLKQISCPKSSRSRQKIGAVGQVRFASVGLFALLSVFAGSAMSGEVRHLKLEEAVRLALEQNRTLRLARLKVKENQAKKSEARSDYFPVITNQSNALHITELQNIVVPAGALGTVAGSAIPPVGATVEQGKETLYTSGTMITQPITQLLR